MIITIASGKGGVGKSMISSYLHKLMGGVALDCDADNPGMHIWLGINNWEEVFPLYLSEKAFEKEKLNFNCPFGAIIEGRVIRALCHGCGFCKIVEPDKVELRKVLTGWIRRKGNLISAKLKPGETGSGKIVEEMKRMASKLGEEIEIRDAPSGLGCAVISAIQGSDLVIIVAEPTLPSLQAIKNVKKLASHFNAHVFVVLNKFDLDDKLSNKIEREEKVVVKIPYREEVYESLIKRELPKIIESEMKELSREVRAWWEEREKC